MAYMVMTYIVVVDISKRRAPQTSCSYIIMADNVMAYIVMAYMVMTDIVVAYISKRRAPQTSCSYVIMVYIVMA